MKAFLGIDTGSISTKGVVIDEDKNIIARSYLWTEGNPTVAARRVADELRSQLQEGGYGDAEVMAVGTTGSARRLVGAILGATVVKNEITKSSSDSVKARIAPETMPGMISGTTILISACHGDAPRSSAASYACAFICLSFGSTEKIT